MSVGSSAMVGGKFPADIYFRGQRLCLVGSFKGFFRPQNAKSKRKTISFQSYLELRRAESSSRETQGEKNEFQNFFTHPPYPWYRFRLVLAGQREKFTQVETEMPIDSKNSRGISHKLGSSCTPKPSKAV